MSARKPPPAKGDAPPKGKGGKLDSLAGRPSGIARQYVTNTKPAKGPKPTGRKPDAKG